MPSWFKKEEKKDDGSQSKSEADLLVEKLGATIDERLKPLRDEFSALKNDWDSIKAEATKTDPPDPTKNADGSEVTAEQKAEREKTTLFALTVQTNARITENECIGSMQQNWPHLINEARELFQKTPWQRKAQPDYAEYCGNVVRMLVGREALKGGLRYDQKASRFLIEDSTTKTGGEASPLNDPDLTWTDPNTGKTLTASEQLRKLNIDPEKFAESMKRGVV